MFSLTNIGLFKINAIAFVFLTSGILLINLKSGLANNSFANATLAQNNKTIEGLSGGSTDSQGCGFIADSPSYKINLSQRIDYMRLTVEAAGGQPTLLVVGPNSGDSFCVLGDETSGLKPEISGVWEAGYYQIYVGDRTQSQHKFILNISTDN
ncbi:MAG: hypothetical protein RLZZ381_1354 [Cyanobacteriota bacterium]|jgi:hypothetical protein